jgi:hypothetical protein
MSTEQNQSLSGGSIATVWHEGSKSFYRAWLIIPLSPEDVAGETAAADGEFPSAGNMPSILASEVKKWKDYNHQVAELLLRNNREETLSWARGLLLSEIDGEYAVTVDHNETNSLAFNPSTQILKGIARVSGDGYKDHTKKNDVVYVWNQEKPAPYVKGQYPRIGHDNWTASTDVFDFSPATVEESIEAFGATLTRLEASTKSEWKNRLLPLLKLRFFLSYNQNYFGEPVGLLKKVIASCCRALDYGPEVVVVNPSGPTVVDGHSAAETTILTGVDACPSGGESTDEYLVWEPAIPTEFPYSQVFVEVKFRNGGSHAGQVREFSWIHTGGSSDIVGFRIRPTPDGYQASGYPAPVTDYQAAGT